MSKTKAFLLKIPVVGRPLMNLIWTVKKQFISFKGSGNYWEFTYNTGGNSGEGSYNRLAAFKAEFINGFLAERNIRKAIEFGCGDGNQLALINYPEYIGLDVSPTAIRNCIIKFQNDTSKSFYLYNSLSFKDNAGLFKSDLSLSLDVIYHLIEDEIFSLYMHHLFGASTKYVLIYSSNFEKPQDHHEKDRVFTQWVAEHITGWKLEKTVKNKFPFDASDPENTSKADFFLYSKI